MLPRIALLLTLAGVVCFTHEALACSCVDHIPIKCRASESNIVFVGTVLSIDNPASDRSNDQGGIARYHFRVDEQLSGVNGNEIDVYSTRGGADCSFHFEKGEQYVVFPNRGGDGRLFAIICSNTRLVRQAQSLLPQLRAVRDGGKVASVFGVLRQTQQPYVNTQQDNFEGPLPNTEVRMVSDTNLLKTMTDENGVFAFYDASPGKYKFEAGLPSHLELAQTILDDPVPPIKLSGNVCEEADLDAMSASKITGRVLAQGEPLDGVTVGLFRADLYKEGAPSWSEYQGKDRHMFFEFNHVTPGDYLLVFNDRNRLDPDAPYPRTFFPGVPDLAHAERIHVEEGQKVVNADIPVSGGRANREVTIQISGSKGQIADAWVSVKGTVGDSPFARRMAFGTYKLSLLREANYEVFAEYACHPSYSEYRKGNYRAWTIETPHIQVNGNDDSVSKIELAFSGGCQTGKASPSQRLR